MPFGSDEGFIAACDIGGGSVVWQDSGINDRVTMYTISTGALREVPLPALLPPTAAYAELAVGVGFPLGRRVPAVRPLLRDLHESVGAGRQAAPGLAAGDGVGAPA